MGEIIPVINEHDEIIGEEAISTVHKSGLLHREAYVYVINSANEVLLQRRVDNSRWDHTAAGHFSKEESYLEGAKRELEEEIGVIASQDELELLGKERLQTRNHRTNNIRFVEVYLLRRDVKIEDCVLQKDEVKEIKYFTKEALLELLATEGFTQIGNSARIIIKTYILPLLG